MSNDSKTIVWIASYPKSGNTWVRFLVCNLVFGLQDSAAALNQLAPDIHELGADQEPPRAPCFMKTHFAFSPSLRFAAHTAAAIYVVRDPADVMVSNFHYSRRSGGSFAANGSPQDFERYAGRYLAARGDPRWLERGIGTWDDHVRSWLGPEQPFPVLPLRYEDLIEDGLRGARQICSFLGLTRSAQEIEQATTGASFRRMRQIEEADIQRRSVGIFYKPYLQEPIGAGLRFMRSGKAGEGAHALSPQQQERLSAVFGPLMEQLGYPRDARMSV